MAEEARQLVILGVGNRLRGDDAIGCIVCDALGAGHDPIPSEESGSCPKPSASRFASDVIVLDCGNTPENYIKPVADGKPSRILVIDCCNYGARPGEFRLFNRSEMEQLSYGLLSTHTLPLTLTVEMLSLETRATIELLGVQPLHIEFDEDLSEPVRRALPTLVEFVRNWVRSPRPRP